MFDLIDPDVGKLGLQCYSIELRNVADYEAL